MGLRARRRRGDLTGLTGPDQVSPDRRFPLAAVRCSVRFPGLASPTGLRGTMWDCETRRFPCGIDPRRSMPSRHETAPGHGSRALDVDEGGLSATSPKLRESAVPGCALQGDAVRFRHISPTHVGMVHSCTSWESSPSVFPTHVGSPVSGVCERPGAHVSSGKGERGRYRASPPFLWCCAVFLWCCAGLGCCWLPLSGNSSSPPPLPPPCSYQCS